MISRPEFQKVGNECIGYLFQQVEREAKVRASNPKISHLDDAQIKLAAAKAEFLDFLYDRFVELEGSLITPVRSAQDDATLAGSMLGERARTSIRTEPKL